MNVFSTRKADAAQPKAQPMTKAALNGIFDEVDNDPLAGMGELTKRDLVIDKLLAHWNVMAGRAAPAPIVANAELDIPVARAAGK